MGQALPCRHRRDHRAQHAAAAESAPGALSVSVVSLGGNEVARLTAKPGWNLADVLVAVREQTGSPDFRGRFLLGQKELRFNNSLEDVGATQDARLTLVSLPPLRVAVQGREGVLELRDSVTGACVHSLDVGGRFVGGRLGLAFSPDGLHVLPLRRETAELWSLPLGRHLRTLRGHERIITAATFSADGLQCLTASDDMTARLWSVATCECSRVLRGHADWVCSARFSPDSLQILTASRDCTARLWSAATGECTRVLRGHEDSLLSCAFSPDGLQVLTGSADRKARLWSTATGECTRILFGHEDWVVSAAAFSPNGLQILTASSDLTARLWSAATAECTHAIHCHTDLVVMADYSSDGLQFITASRDGMARLWSAATGECMHTLQTLHCVAAFVPETLDVSTLAVSQAEPEGAAQAAEGGGGADEGLRAGEE